MIFQAVYDTNVIVSALLKPGSIPSSLVSLAMTGRVQLCLSPAIHTEYDDVIRSPRFAFPAAIFPFPVFENIRIVTPAIFAQALAEQRLS